MKTTSLTSMASVGIPVGRNSEWLRDILASVLAAGGREDVRLCTEGEACDLAIDLEGDGLPAHQGRLVRFCPEGDCGVPDPREWHYSPDSIVWRGASVRHGLMVVVQAGRAFVLSPLRELGIPDGLVETALAAVAAAQALGIDPTAIRAGLVAWRAGFCRLRLAGERSGVRAWDDAACGDEYEMLRALRCFGRKVTLVTGGPGFDPDFDPEIVLAYSNRIHLLPGTPVATQRLWETVLQAQVAREAREAIRLGFERTSAGGTLLVSPGCAFGQDLSALLREELSR